MGRRSSKKKEEATPTSAAKPDLRNTSVPIPITQWAQGLIEAVSDKVPPAELAILRSQTNALDCTPGVSLSLPPDPTRPTIVRDQDALRTLAAKINLAPEVVVDLETSSLDPRSGVIVGIGLAIHEGTFYIPVSHSFENGTLRPNQLSLAEALTALRLQDKPLINHNDKFEIKWLRHHGNITCQFVWDTMIAARLLHSNLSAELKEVAARELDVPDWDMPKADKQRIQFLPIERVAGYCAKDCLYSLMLCRRQQACLINSFLMNEVEMPLVEVVAAMEETGYLVSVGFFHDLRARLEPEAAELLTAIRKRAKNADFNPNSHEQLRKFLFEKLKLKPVAWTKRGDPSTKGNVLERLRPGKNKEVVDQLIRLRKLSKIVSTYCTVPDKLSGDGRFRVDFNQLAAETGRFSSPSLIQTIPKKNDEFGIRKGFVARDGYMIVGADFKQQELRVLAQVSKDKNLRKAINDNIDMHGFAAVKIYGLKCEPNEVEDKHPEKREAIKSIQFGIIYGRTAHGLAGVLNIGKEEAERLIEDYFKQFPGVKRFVQQVHADLMRDGYIDDVFGRRRHFPEVKRKVPRKRYQQFTEEEKKVLSSINAAKRQAQNFVIQGASATITKLAMNRCHKHITAKYGDAIRMLLTLHDELQFEVCADLVPEFAGELPGLMCNLGLERFGFTVHMAVDVKVGPSWGEMVKWKKESQDGNHNAS
jgi:DNA polymerase I